MTKKRADPAGPFRVLNPTRVSADVHPVLAETIHLALHAQVTHCLSHDELVAHLLARGLEAVLEHDEKTLRALWDQARFRSPAKIGRS